MVGNAFDRQNPYGFEIPGGYYGRDIHGDWQQYETEEEYVECFREDKNE